jgi:hypothetical protein
MGWLICVLRWRMKSSTSSFAHRSFVKAEVELPESDSGGDGKVVPVELVLQDRRDTAP